MLSDRGRQARAQKHSQEEVGFLQTFNLHRDGKSAAREFIMSKRFAKIAADLMRKGAHLPVVRSRQEPAWLRRFGTATEHGSARYERIHHVVDSLEIAR